MATGLDAFKDEYLRRGAAYQKGSQPYLLAFIFGRTLDEMDKDFNLQRDIYADRTRLIQIDIPFGSRMDEEALRGRVVRDLKDTVELVKEYGGYSEPEIKTVSVVVNSSTGQIILADHAIPADHQKIADYDFRNLYAQVLDITVRANSPAIPPEPEVS